MPTYSFSCTQCKEHKDISCRIGERNSQYCSKCAVLLCRIISSPAIAFKGDGFYCVDNKK